MKAPLETPYKVPSRRLVKNGGMTFEISSNDPFTGISIEYDLNGQPKEKTNYKDGKELSETRFTYPDNGQLQNTEEEDNKTNFFLILSFVLLLLLIIFFFFW